MEELPNSPGGVDQGSSGCKARNSSPDKDRLYYLLQLRPRAHNASSISQDPVWGASYMRSPSHLGAQASKASHFRKLLCRDRLSSS